MSFSVCFVTAGKVSYVLLFDQKYFVYSSLNAEGDLKTSCGLQGGGEEGAAKQKGMRQGE